MADGPQGYQDAAGLRPAEAPALTGCTGRRSGPVPGYAARRTRGRDSSPGAPTRPDVTVRSVRGEPGNLGATCLGLVMIEVNGLAKRYGDKTAVNDLTFTVRPGMVTGFLGPNGAGKPVTELRHSSACPGATQMCSDQAGRA
jgi:ABC-type multidrug transport system fused ATPase/permease subunit